MLKAKASNDDNCYSYSHDALGPQVKLPAFLAEDPELWFILVENSFSLAGIVEEEAKFSHLTIVLDMQVLAEVRDILMNMPQENPYTVLKAEILKRLCPSQEEKAVNFFKAKSMGDRKPTQFLRHLRFLAGSSVPESLIRSVWFMRLPEGIRTILQIENRKNIEIERLAEKADLLSYYMQPRLKITDDDDDATSEKTEDFMHQLGLVVSGLMEEIEKLRTEVSVLREKIFA